MPLAKFSVTPTITAGAYAANDIIGGRLQFVGFRSGLLYSISIADKAAQNVNYVLILFDTVPTDIVDNAPYDFADADLANILRIEDMSTTYRLAFIDNSITIKDGLDVLLRSEESDGDIWAFLYTTGAPSYASTSDITVTLRAWVV